MYHSHTVRRQDVAILLVDVQEKLFSVMSDRETMLSRIRLLLEGARILGIPVLVSEQYSKGLGSTLSVLSNHLSGARVIEKDSFSCFGAPAFAHALRDTERRQILVAGIETHICVLQTCFDAKAQGYDVFVAADAVTTRLPHTGLLGLERLRAAGISLTSVEGALFEMLETRLAPEFKTISALVREAR